VSEEPIAIGHAAFVLRCHESAAGPTSAELGRCIDCRLSVARNTGFVLQIDPSIVAKAAHDLSTVARSQHMDRLLLLLEQILEDELAPSAAACVHQRATLVELSQLDGCEPELFGKATTGAVASSSSLDRKTTRWPPSTIGSAARWPQSGD